MKTRYKILIPLAVIFAIGLFCLYIIASGNARHVNGIGLVYFYETDPDKILNDSLLSGIIEITDDDLEKVPRIKGMLEIALDQEFPLKDDGFSLLDSNFNSYWVNKDGQDIRIQIGMSNEDAEKYGDWLRDNVFGRLVKYQDRYFAFSQWIA